MTLLKTDKLRIDAQIDAGIPSTLPFTGIQHAVAALLFGAEVRWRHWDIEILRLHGLEASEVAGDISREALHWAVIWSHQKLGACVGDTGFSLTEKDIENAYQLLHLAAEYSELCDLMVGTFQAQVEVKQVSENVLEWCPSPEQLAFEAAQFLWRGVQAREAADAKDPCGGLISWINDQGDALDLDSSLVFRIPVDILNEIQVGLVTVSERRWQLPENIELSLFTTSQFKKFWLALMTAAVPHRRIYAETGVPNCALPIGSIEQWNSLLASLSGLKPDVVSTMMSFLTYSIETTQKVLHKRTADIISQPFFQLNENILALSTFLTLSSSAERNMFDLLSNKMSDEYEGIKDLKEEQWATSLANRFLKFGLHALSQRKIPDQGGDVDLFVFDSTNNIGLVVQLKWFLVDRIKSTHLEQGTSAIDQANASVDWIRNSTEQASKVLNVPVENLKQAKLLPLGIIKEGLLGGYLWNDEIPLISDTVFEHAFSKFGRDINEIWNYAHNKRFLPELGRHYKADRIVSVPASGRPFNGVSFQKPLLEKLTDWNP